jgi:hypothetical protein
MNLVIQAIIFQEKLGGKSSVKAEAESDRPPPRFNFR